MKFTLLLSVILCLSIGNLQAQNILLSEDFENTILPAGWSQTTNSNDGGWINGTSVELESQYWPIAVHGNFIATNDDACDCDKSVDYLITPPLNFALSSSAVLQFQNYYDGGSLFGGTEVATVEYSLDNGANWTVLEEIQGTEDGAWDVQTIILGSLAGNEDVLLAFHYFDDGEWLFGWAIDDVIVFEPEGLDLAITSLNLANTIDVPASIPVTGVVTNNGLEEINSFEASWSIGGANFTSNFSGLSIPSLGTYNFVHPDQLEITQSGSYEIIVTISNVNGMASDLNESNNSITNTFQALEYGTITDGGITREFIYYHPSSAPENCPLVFVCHGYTGTAQGIMDYSEFNALAEEFGFAVCYPQGIEDSFGNTFFNVGYDFQNNETVDDVAYIQHLSEHLHTNNSLSEEDVFCTGLSNGGDFAYMLACQASETFKAVAPVAGMILQEIMDNCNPESEVSIFEIHGTEDDVTYFEGDPNNIDNWGAYPSVPDMISFWTDFYNLDVQTSEQLADTNPNDGSTVAADKYSQENSCTQVWLYTIEGGGHDWPGAWGNMDISASKEVWLFFEQLCDTTVGTEEPEVLSELQNRKLLRIVDILGREVKEQANQVLFYQYTDGSVEKKMIVE